ncbi:phage DNA ejection protein [Escherichia coli]|uniref:phage DNA ejection protein n=1 Tax=Escherichia coli TaxID=562 RepID=UPI000BB5C8B4|nr:phage DNA ejection protein [Escherichia coli]EJT4787669.1 phage DNA ejection protein [Escherichia coli]MBW0609413.1 phage DNA ejection protein [Escherichia coli]PBQ47195.1 acyltransferase [Escherichia coli]HBD0643796.1 phage DNA ejection protein [Escherichia coli]HDI8587280.1 phage DNA ejection protein [Escherichia coli]
MATWQQGINSGGFLAGIGGQNSNAPKASDVSEALAYIRQNNEMERSGRNNIGLQALQGLGSVAQTYQAAKQQEADAAFQKEYAAAIQSGDRQQVRDLMTKYPGQLEKIQSGMKWADEDQRNSIGTLAAGARLASSSPEAMKSWLQNNAKELARVGVDPNNVAQMYQQNPSGFGEFVDHLGMAALGPIDYFNVQDKMAGREIDRGRLAETIRSNQAGEALTARGQDIQIRGQNISAQNAALSREIQRAELQEKALDRQIARESNQLKLEELKQKQADVRQKADIARADRQAAAQGAVDTFSTALDSLNEIEQSPGLSKAVGIRSAFPTVPGSDAANFEARLDTFKAQTFLPMVQSLKGMGALSDAEGKKLSDAVGALSPKMSEKAFRDSIGKIRNQLESKLSSVKKQFDYQEPVQNTPGQQSTTGSNFSSLWGD